MIRQQGFSIPDSGYTREDLSVIVRRAHLERAEEMRAFFAWLFTRRKTAAAATGQPVRMNAVACG